MMVEAVESSAQNPLVGLSLTSLTPMALTTF